MDRCIRLYGWRERFLALGFGVASAIGFAPAQAQELCGGVDYPFPYTDVAGVGAAFCPGIMEAYVTGVSRGTTPTTFSPDETVSRVQMTTFLQRSLEQGLGRASRRAALNQWWTPQATSEFPVVIDVGMDPTFCAADGADIWVVADGQLVQVQANTNMVLTFFGGSSALYGLVAVEGFIFVTNATSPGNLNIFDIGQGTLNVLDGLGNFPTGIAFDGINLWTANAGPPGSVSIVTLEPTPTLPYPVTTITTGFNSLLGVLYDGAHIWVTDAGAGKLYKLDPSGNIIQTVTVGVHPSYPVFDGANIWVPNSGDNSITVVQASSGNVVATILADATTNRLNGPTAASFDGERILVTNHTGGSVTLFKAADLSFITSIFTGPGSGPFGACSDGISFWVTQLTASGGLRRF